MNLAYIRISSNKQDCQSQKVRILEYCQKNKIVLDEIIEVEMSSTKSLEKRRINELRAKLSQGDLLITNELSRLGRNMVEVIYFVLNLAENGVQFVFLKQPMLSSFKNPYSKLLLTFYAYMAETERDFITERTKDGLLRARQNGKKLGRPFGIKSSAYDKDIDKIKELFDKGLTISSVWKLLYAQQGKSYNGFRWYCNTRGLIKSKKRKKS